MRRLGAILLPTVRTEAAPGLRRLSVDLSANVLGLGGDPCAPERTSLSSARPSMARPKGATMRGAASPAGPAGGTMDLVHVLKNAVDQGCSDVHILVGKPPMMRRNGEIRPIDPSLPVLSGEETKGLIYSMLYEDQQARFEENLERDCSHDTPGPSRSRAPGLTAPH